MNWKFWKRKPPENADGNVRNPITSWLAGLWGGGESDSGVQVDAYTAQKLAPVWQALNVISGDMGAMPVHCFTRQADDARERDREHPGYRVMRRPNDYMTGFVLRNTLQSHALMRGNGYGWIIRNGTEPDEVWPLLPDRTSPKLLEGRFLVYETKIPQGDNKPDKELILMPDEVIHIKGLGSDGIRGYSVIELARNNWGLGLAQEKHGARTFKNRAMPGVALETDQFMDKVEAEKLLDGWRNLHEGADNVGKTALLHSGVKAHTLSMSNEDAQFLESRKFTRTDVASWFNLPPHMVGDLEHATFTNIEHQARAYLQQTLMHWIIKWQEELNEKLLTKEENESESKYFEFNTNAILKGDTLSRFQAYQIAISGRWMNPNEVRARENMNPYDGGDEFVNPNTMTSGSPGGESDDEPVEPDEDAQAIENAHRALIHDRAERMLKIEAQKIHKAAKGEKNFISWLDGFYMSFAPTLLHALEIPFNTAAVSCRREFPDAGHFAKAWCSDHKQAVLDACGEVSQDALLETMQTLTASWTADELTDRLFPEAESCLAA